MASKRRRARRITTWRRYQARLDRLAPMAPTPDAYTSDGRFVVKVNQGFFRAEGWDTRGKHRRMLGHGA